MKLLVALNNILFGTKLHNDYITSTAPRLT